jgi:HEAT repeat protein
MSGPRWAPARWQLALINLAIVLAIVAFAYWRHRTPAREQEPTDPDRTAEQERAEKERAEVARLIVLLGDADLRKRLFAADRLAKLGPKAAPATAALVRRAKDRLEDLGVRNSAVNALAAVGPGARDAVEPLTELLRRGDDWGTRSLAARALGEIGSPAAIGPLREALNDENEEVRTSARAALGKIEWK